MKSEKVELSPEVAKAFEELKMKCLMAPVLAFTDFSRPFVLETDASEDGLGAVLSQKQDDGRYHLVAYTSRVLHGGEKNYHSSKLEFLALKWAMTEQFWECLQYGLFLVKTDNNPLTYILTTLNLNATGHQWVASLASFNMSLEYLCGTDNKVADTLSCIGPVWLEKEVVVVVVLERARHSNAPRAECDDPRMIQQVETVEEDVIIQVRAIADDELKVYRLQQANWPMLQWYDPIICHVIETKQLPDTDHTTLDQFKDGKVHGASGKRLHFEPPERMILVAQYG